MKNGLYITATPIGNLEDITFRAVDVLKNATAILCEDTRTSLKLLAHYDIKTKLIPYHEHNADKIRPKIIKELKEGKTFALISDAGTPLISDPGYKLARDAKNEGVFVTSIPGPCAVINALVLSAMPSDKFFFAGFLPVKDKARKDLALSLFDLEASLIFYESPKRISDSIVLLQKILHNRTFKIAREMTKIYEEVIEPNQLAENVKGEIVVIASPPDKNIEIPDEQIILLLKKELVNSPLKKAVQNAALALNVNKNKVYSLALEIKNGKA